ncbi:MAG TPA: hypothetical protein VF625_04800 [Longimicrobium sp.]|jgi:hypothetical protein
MAQDSNDFLTAFAIGTALGVGATLLLRPRPRPRSARERVMRELKPGRVRGGPPRSPAQHGHGGVEAAGGMAEEVISVGRELLDEFREEVQRILSDARDQLRDVAADDDDGREPASAGGI